jgi:type I restriction enzyme S subunit
MNHKIGMPQLRFKEFDGEWKNEQIGKYIDLISGIAFKGEDISEDSTGVPILRGINITEGYIRHNENIDRYYLGNTDKLDKIRLKEGDLVLGMDGSKVGKNSALVSKKDVDSLLIQRVARLRAKKNTSLEFIYLHINSIIFHKYVDVVNTSSGIPHISSKQINDFKIYLPQFPEQQKIASFLSAVDEKIQQLSRKKELLEQYKKGIMQQLFSGKLRFKDENGNDYADWEEKKLGEVAIITMGQSPESISYNTDSLGMLLIQGNADIKERVTLPRQWTSQPTKTCEIGDLILTVRAPVGSIAKSSHSACIGRGVCSIINNKSSVQEYLYQFLLSYESKWTSLEQGSTFTAVSGNDIKSLKLNLPQLPEQHKIASFLSSIDAKIESANQQITQTQTFKKGLLQQLFV